MTSTSSLGLYGVLLLMVGAFGLVGLAVMGSPAPTIYLAQTEAGWLAGRQVAIPTGLARDAHSHKHDAEAWNFLAIQGTLLTGQCVASAQLCQHGSPHHQMFLCNLPGTDLWGALFLLDNVWHGGHTRYEDKWRDVIDNGNWQVCP